MKRHSVLLLALCLCLVCCKSREPLLPSVSGKAGELVVVSNAEVWNGQAGSLVRETLGCDCPWFVMPEPMFTLIHITQGAFGDLFKVHRNILIFDVSENVDSASTKLYHNVWARPQCVMKICARTAGEAAGQFEQNRQTIVAAFSQAERDRVVSGVRKYAQADVRKAVMDSLGGSPCFPSGYTLRKVNGNFAWIEYSRTKSTQCIFVYKYPRPQGEPFTLEALVAARDSVMKTNVPGPREGSYVYTSTEVMAPSVEFTRYKSREFAQLRGWWELEGDYMGGPFVSQCFYSEDGTQIVCEEAFLYYPKDKKRLLFHQIESILYSWEWNDGQAEK